MDGSRCIVYDRSSSSSSCQGQSTCGVIIFRAIASRRCCWIRSESFIRRVVFVRFDVSSRVWGKMGGGGGFGNFELCMWAFRSRRSYFLCRSLPNQNTFCGFFLCVFSFRLPNLFVFPALILVDDRAREVTIGRR